MSKKRKYIVLLSVITNDDRAHTGVASNKGMSLKKAIELVHEMSDRGSYANMPYKDAILRFSITVLDTEHAKTLSDKKENVH